jgi:hypothetical protein
MLTGVISGAQVGSIFFDGQTFLHPITDTKGGDRSVEFRLQGREAIVDFLLSPGVSDDVTLSCLRHTRALDGKGLIALQYDERFKLGQVDGDDVKALRKRAIDAMAKFDMSEVKEWYARGK